jgi:hypothetical protein
MVMNGGILRHEALEQNEASITKARTRRENRHTIRGKRRALFYNRCLKCVSVGRWWWVYWVCVCVCVCVCVRACAYPKLVGWTAPESETA